MYITGYTWKRELICLNKLDMAGKIAQWARELAEQARISEFRSYHTSKQLHVAECPICNKNDEQRGDRRITGLC